MSSRDAIDAWCREDVFRQKTTDPDQISGYILDQPITSENQNDPPTQFIFIFKIKNSTMKIALIQYGMLYD